MATPVREYVVIWAKVTRYGLSTEQKEWFARRSHAYDVRDVVQDWARRHAPELLMQKDHPGKRVRDMWSQLHRVIPFQYHLHCDIPADCSEWPWPQGQDVP
jgi:hypothetical protein